MTVMDTARMDTIYSSGAETEDVDENYYPSPSSCGFSSTSASSVAVRGAHIALPDGFWIYWDDNRENGRCRQRGGVGQGIGQGKGLKGGEREGSTELAERLDDVRVCGVEGGGVGSVPNHGGGHVRCNANRKRRDRN